MGVGRIFSRGDHQQIFRQVTIKIFQRGAKSDEISFFPLETKKTTFFAKNIIKKYETSKSIGPLPPFRRPWLLRDIPTSIYAFKMPRPRVDVSPCPLATPLSSRQNHVCFKLYSQIHWSWTKLQKLSYWHILQNKNCSYTCSEMLNPVPYFPSIEFSHTQLYR